MSSHLATWTSLIIDVSLYAFKNGALLRSALAKTFLGVCVSKLTVWKEEQFTVLPFQGIEQRKKRVAEWVVKALPLAKPGVWGCVQARSQWSTEEHTSDLVTTGCVSLVMLVMAKVVRSSSISIIASAKIIGAHASTMKTLLSSSSAGSTEWSRMCQD